MASEISDDILSQFLAFTGSSDPSVARQYLEMSGNNLETAVSLFMDHGAGGAGAGGMGGGASSSSSGGAAAGAGAGFGSPQVRAPDATRSERLVGGPSVGGGGGRGGYGGGGMGGGGGFGVGGGMGGLGGDEPSAALMAAIGGPAAREMMRNMMASQNGGMGGDMMGGQDAMMGSMGSTWAAAGGGGGSDFRDTGRSGSAGRRSRSGSGASGTGAAAGGNRNAGRSSQRRSSNNNNNDSDDDDVQVVDANGDAMDEDEDDEYNYPDSDDDDDDSHDLGGASSGNAHSGRGSNAPPPSLSTMFAQPTHLMHRAGGFMGAKNFAKDARRWLLVNIQSDDDFACHALNRDVWRDELVENLVREGFILWQAMSHSNEGQTYVQRYKVNGYPHLAIIDPRTGSLLWRKEGWTQVNPLTAEQFVEIASDFCSRHSFDKMPTAARHAYTNGVPLGATETASNESRPANNNKRPIHELTEEEQLQAAIRASMEEDAAANEKDDDDVEVVDVTGDDEEKPSANDDTADENNAEEESETSAFEKEILSMSVEEEPTSGSVARVQIRMPDGKRLVRKFAGDSHVKAIYAFVAQSNEEAKGGRAFELKAKFPPQDLFANIEDGVSSCGLNGEAINVIWK